jgi:hypothetical protein
MIHDKKSLRFNPDLNPYYKNSEKVQTFRWTPLLYRWLPVSISELDHEKMQWNHGLCRLSILHEIVQAPCPTSPATHRVTLGTLTSTGADESHGVQSASYSGRGSRHQYLLADGQKV